MHRCLPAEMSKLILFLFIALLIIAQALAYKCAGDEFPLDISPKGEKYVRFGDSLTLYCALNTSHPEGVGYTSADLSFFRTNETKRIKINSKILNDSTISADLEGLPPQEYHIYCVLNENGGEDKEKSCPTYVAVGFEPEKVTNFSCVSYNWEELVCRWYPPETNVIKTEYTLTFDVVPTKNRTETRSFSSGRGEGPSRFKFSCPKNETVKNMCHLTGGTTPPYRQGHEYYKFRLTGRNPLGYSTTTINFNNYAHVIPNKPGIITTISQTVGSAFINWTVPHPMNLFRKGLRSKIIYRSEWDPPNQWKEIRVNSSAKKQGNNSVNKQASFYVYNITGLEYAHTRYDVKIYLQSGAAEGDSYWSDPGIHSFVTLSTIPSKAPKTSAGSFHMTSRGDSSDVIVYWNGIPDYMKNGEDFGYDVICRMNNKVSCGSPIEATLSYAKYRISSNYEYQFSIYSINKVGRSENSSQVFVPKWGLVPLPKSLTRVTHANGVYELSWLPVRHENLSSYTIFWCEDEQSLPLPCKGIIDWIDVDGNMSVINITMKSMQKFYNFAIAANLKDGSSSGMVWLTCVVLHDKVDKTVNDVIVRIVSPREADIVWQVECAERSSFRGYYVYYCPALSIQSNECLDPGGEQTIFVNEFQTRNIMLEKLKPYTTYRVQISIISFNGTQEKIGPRSKSVRFTTLEDAPTEPINLRKVLATNSSVTLAWDLPLEMNGVLQKYKLEIESLSSLRESTSTIEAKDSNDTLVTRFVVNDLHSYTKYRLALRACTSDTKCSNPSSPLEVMTRAGFPGKMRRPQVRINNTVAFLEWEPPDIAAGDLNYYELFVSVNGSEDKIKNITGLRDRVVVTDCSTAFKIRAINVDGDKVYKGPWSAEAITTCYESASKSTALVVWIACICIFIVILAALFCIAKRGWLHCRKMNDVEVKLPPGLQNQDLEKDNQDYFRMDVWPPRTNDAMEGFLDSGIAPDEPLLLGNKSDDHKNSFNMANKNGGDSSGCSVGRESLSSSAASDNHASSDSGAEADQCINGSFGEWGPVQGISNGNLCDGTKTRDIRKGGVPEDPIDGCDLDNWNQDESPPPVYTRVGFTESQNAEKSLPGKGYVTISSITPACPPFKTDSEGNFNCLPMDNFPLLYEGESHGLGSAGKGSNSIPSNPSPCYVTLAYLQERGVEECASAAVTAAAATATATVPSISRNITKEKEKCEDEKREPAESVHVAPSTSGRERAKKCASMPPYVSMIENPGTTSSEDGEEDGEGAVEGGEDGCDEKEEARNEEVGKRSSDLGASGLRTVSGINGGVVSKIVKDGESYSNYIPHRVFGQESVHTK